MVTEKADCKTSERTRPHPLAKSVQPAERKLEIPEKTRYLVGGRAAGGSHAVDCQASGDRIR